MAPPPPCSSSSYRTGAPPPLSFSYSPIPTSTGGDTYGVGHRAIVHSSSPSPSCKIMCVATASGSITPRNHVLYPLPLHSIIVMVTLFPIFVICA